MATCTCMGCGQQSIGRPVTGAWDSNYIDHLPDCPVSLGAVWECGCPGPYCGPECEGRWVDPKTGETVSISPTYLATLPIFDEPDVPYTGPSSGPYAGGRWRGSASGLPPYSGPRAEG